MALSALLTRGPRGSVGLDLDASYVAAVQTDGHRIIRAASAEVPPGLINEGEVDDIDGVGRELRGFFRRNGLPRSVRLGVANQQVAVRSLEIPPIADDEERAAAVRFQASEAIAMPLEEAVLDYQPIGTASAPGGAALMRVVVVAAREPMILRLVEAVRAAGLRPEAVDLSAFALLRVLAPRGLDEAAPARVYCHVAGITNLAIAVGSTCLFTRPLATVWDGGSPDFSSALAEEIRLSIDYYMSQSDAQPVTDVVLSGPGTREPRIAEDLGALVGHSVSIAPPLGGLDAQAVPPDQDVTRLTVAAGLSLGEVE